MEPKAFRHLIRSARRGHEAAVEQLCDYFLPDLEVYVTLGCDDEKKRILLLQAVLGALLDDLSKRRFTEGEAKAYLFRLARLLLGAQDHDPHAAFPFVMRRSPEEASKALAGDQAVPIDIVIGLERLAQLSRGQQEAYVLINLCKFNTEDAAELMKVPLERLQMLLE